MALFTITRLLDISADLATQAGQQLATTLAYLSEFVEQTARSLRQGLTFRDNFDASVRITALKHGQAQKISATKQATAILAVRVSDPKYLLDAFNWYYDPNGDLTVLALFKASDLSTTIPSTSLDVTLVVLF